MESGLEPGAPNPVISPRASPPRRIWLFGYGSLISEASRQRTASGLTGDHFPATVKGLSRGWFTSVDLPEAMCPNSRIPRVQAMGILEGSSSSARCSGVVFGITPDALLEFDHRETGYSRVLVDWDRVSPAIIGDHGQHLWLEAHGKGEELFCYVQRAHTRPSSRYPIVQTYLDVMMAGCADISEEFVRDFIRTTSAWPEGNGAVDDFIDDRAEPGYIRFCDEASKRGPLWDEVLECERPGILSLRSRICQQELAPELCKVASR